MGLKKFTKKDPCQKKDLQILAKNNAKNMGYRVAGVFPA
jgi:hypothetical protein